MKKLISIFMCVATVFGCMLLPVSASEPKVIKGVDIAVRSDIAGKTVKEDYRDIFVINSEGVDFDEEYFENSNQTEVIKAGESYHFTLALVAKEGYVFPEYDCFEEGVWFDGWQDSFYNYATVTDETDGHTSLRLRMPNSVDVDPEEEAEFGWFMRLLEAVFDFFSRDDVEEIIDRIVNFIYEYRKNKAFERYAKNPYDLENIYDYQRFYSVGFTNDRIVEDIKIGNVDDIELLMCRDIKDKTENLNAEIKKLISLIDGEIIEYTEHIGVGGSSHYSNYGIIVSQHSTETIIKTTQGWYSLDIGWITLNTREPDEFGISGISLSKIDISEKNSDGRYVLSYSDYTRLASIVSQKEFMP